MREREGEGGIGGQRERQRTSDGETGNRRQNFDQTRKVAVGECVREGE